MLLSMIRSSAAQDCCLLEATMQSYILVLGRALTEFYRLICLLRTAGLFVLGVSAISLPSLAQQSTPSTDSQQQIIQLLMERVEKLEARVAKLEAARPPGAAVTTAPVEPIGTQSESTP